MKVSTKSVFREKVERYTGGFIEFADCRIPTWRFPPFDLFISDPTRFHAPFFKGYKYDTFFLGYKDENTIVHLHIPYVWEYTKPYNRRTFYLLRDEIRLEFSDTKKYQYPFEELRGSPFCYDPHGFSRFSKIQTDYIPIYAALKVVSELHRGAFKGWAKKEDFVLSSIVRRWHRYIVDNWKDLEYLQNFYHDATQQLAYQVFAYLTFVYKMFEIKIHRPSGKAYRLVNLYNGEISPQEWEELLNEERNVGALVSI